MNMFKTFSIVIAATMFCLIAGCDKAEVAAPADEKGNSLGIKADCIICVDHPMDVTDKTPHCEYKGKAYYFCSDDCLKTFEKDPEKALATYKEKKSPASQPATAPGH
jgi:YHS domain-containing protein